MADDSGNACFICLHPRCPPSARKQQSGCAPKQAPMQAAMQVAPYTKVGVDFQSAGSFLTR